MQVMATIPFGPALLDKGTEASPPIAMTHSIQPVAEQRTSVLRPTRSIKKTEQAMPTSKIMLVIRVAVNGS